MKMPILFRPLPFLSVLALGLLAVMPAWSKDKDRCEIRYQQHRPDRADGRV
ncbi:hypothetical protein [Niveispirillum cyanobacteriorum]|uniref:hypothetical protein n=1 Tax=Niveispirillum cyanobacteriorum TaxID=1612173 RepID=UPI00131A132F|nr:hypothetical protein [Niveispirillum cyanobacteriorum]